MPKFDPATTNAAQTDPDTGTVYSWPGTGIKHGSWWNPLNVVPNLIDTGLGQVMRVGEDMFGTTKQAKPFKPNEPQGPLLPGARWQYNETTNKWDYIPPPNGVVKPPEPQGPLLPGARWQYNETTNKWDYIPPPAAPTASTGSTTVVDPNKSFMDNATSRINDIYGGMDLGKYFTYTPDAGAKATMEQAVKSVSDQGAIAKAAIDNAYAQGIITSNEAAAAAQQARYAQSQMLGQLFQQGGAAVEKMNANNQNSYNNIYGNVGRLGADNGAASDMASMLYATSPVEAQYAAQLGDIGNSQMLDLGKLLIASQGADQSRLGQALAQENSRVQMQYAKEEQARRDSIEASRRQAEMAREQAKADALGSLLNTQLKTEYENGIGMDQKMKGQAKADAYNNGATSVPKLPQHTQDVPGSYGDGTPHTFIPEDVNNAIAFALRASSQVKGNNVDKRAVYLESLTKQLGPDGYDNLRKANPLYASQTVYPD